MYVAQPTAGAQGEDDADPVEVMRRPAEQHDADGGQRHVGQLSGRPRQACGQAQRAEQLDRHGDSQRQPVDRLVEADVHRRQHEPEGETTTPVRPVAARQAAAGRSPAGPMAANPWRSSTVPGAPTRSNSEAAIAAPSCTETTEAPISGILVTEPA